MKLPIPGIYVQEQEYTLNPLRIDTRTLAAFVGICERGPLDTPVLIKNFDGYLKLFGGFETTGMLPYSIYSFFKCGGSECIVVRVADKTEAASAILDIPTGGTSIKLTASSTGKWGNYIHARIWHETENPVLLLSADYEKGLWIEADSDVIDAGDAVRISVLGRELYRTVIRKDNRKLYLSKPVGLFKRLHENTAKIVMERVYFSMMLAYKDEQESFLRLSVNPASERYYKTYINNRSRLCSVYGDEKLQHDIPLPAFSLYATGGNDGIADMNPSDFIGFYNGPNEYAGLGSLESFDDISLIAVPDAWWLLRLSGKLQEQREKAVLAVQEAMVRQAQRFAGRYAVLDAPDAESSTDVRRWAQHFDSSFAAAYYPFIDMLDPCDAAGIHTIRIPPSAAVCGCIVATDGEKGVFYPPANQTIAGAVGVSHRPDESEQELLGDSRVNVLRYFPGKGIKIWGARTLSSDAAWRYINVRRTFSRISQSIQRGTRWAVFETNDKKLRKRIVRQVSGFLLDLWMKGYLSGSTPEQGFYVRCDEELNPVENIDKGIIAFEVGLAIVKPVEFFIVHITAEKDGASVYIKET